MKKSYIATGRKEQKQKTRKKILSSAQKFLARGTDFTLEDVAGEASISRATIYRYYSNVEVLSGEAGIDLHTKSPEAINKELSDLDLKEAILEIQDYFNHLAIDNEQAFRKYLSVVITSSPVADKRGARRNKTLELAFADKHTGLTKNEIENLTNIASVLMGIEPMIVAKDVCHLDNKASLELLKWGLEMLLRGVYSTIDTPRITD